MNEKKSFMANPICVIVITVGTMFGCSQNNKNVECEFEFVKECPECRLDTLKNDIGQIEMVISKKGELKHGLIISWHPNGQKSAENYYKEGKMHGPQKMWDKDGNLIGNSIWKDGTFIK